MDTLQNFVTLVNKKETRVGIIGLGYVGLPLMLTFIEKGFRVIGFDTDTAKVASLMDGKSYIKHIDGKNIEKAVKSKMFYATENFNKTANCQALIICVPTPLNKNREPDMRYIKATAESIKPVTDGQLIVLESTTYPGTTEELLKDILEKDGKVAGKDFFLAFSPEREDPGNQKFNTKNIPKIIGGHTVSCATAADKLYSAVLDKTHVVSGTKVAEATKILENTFRCVNIALVNELKKTFDAMGINIWEVIDAASTKPFGYMPFYPGPGLGGHCIPIDPYYLTWKAREYDQPTEFIELAGKINTDMPHYVLDKIFMALNDQKKPINRSTVLILGIAYKKNIDDMRESPALPIMDKLLSLGAMVRFSDPHISKLLPSRHFNLLKKYPNQFSDQSFDLKYEADYEYLRGIDLVVIVTDHDSFDYERIIEQSNLIVDCRNATAKVPISNKRALIFNA